MTTIRHDDGRIRTYSIVRPAGLALRSRVRGLDQVALRFAEVDGRLTLVRVEIGADLESPRPNRPDPAPIRSGTLRALARQLSGLIGQGGRSYEHAMEALGRRPELSPRQRGDVEARKGVAQPRAGRGRPVERGPDHFHEVADVYIDAWKRGRPNPTAAVQKHFKVAYSTAAKWVQRSRNEFGYLPPTKKGQANAKGADRRRRED